MPFGRAVAIALLLAPLLGGVAACASPRPARLPGAEPAAASAAAAREDAHEANGEPDTDGDPEADDEPPTSDGPMSERRGPCPRNMAFVEGRFCIDVYEASLVETQSDGAERPYPHYLPVDGHSVRAVSEPGVFPQGFISQVQAADACAASGKRLCRHDEWKTACMGPSRATFPYGESRRPGACHDAGKSAVVAVFGAQAVAASQPYTPSAPRTASAAGAKPAGARAGDAKTGGARTAGTKTARPTKGRAASVTVSRAPRARGPHAPSKGHEGARATKGSVKATKQARASRRPASVDPGVWGKLNDPALGQVEGALARTGEHPECVNGYGVLDMVGNLHEWVIAPRADGHGTFAGGYYLDTSINGDGCHYRTTAHAEDYHDYSTGFRCCADPTYAADADVPATGLAPAADGR